MIVRLICLALLAFGTVACASTGASTEDGQDVKEGQIASSSAEETPSVAAPGVAFTPSRTTFVRNDRIGLKLVNNTSEPVGYDLCYTRIEMKIEGQWHVAEDYPDYCEPELRVLEVGKSADYGLNMGEVLPAGQYRVLTEVEAPHGSARQTLMTVELELSD